MADQNYPDYIRKQLKKLSKHRKVEFTPDKKYAKTICVNPNHKGGKENTPSLRINIEKRVVKTRTYQPGSGKCFACGAYYGNWKRLMLALDRPDLVDHMDQAQEDDSIQVKSFFSVESDDAIIGQDNEQVQLLADLQGAMPWSSNEEWRSIRGSILAKLNAKLYFNSHEKIETVMLWLPCVVNGREVGGVSANIEKRGKNNYFNSPGVWTNSLGLFPYDYTVKMLARKHYTTLVLVEGPRDALNLLQNGIPALAVLGSGNWSDVKADLVTSLPIENIITAFDGDEAGDRVKLNAYQSLKDQFHIRNLDFRMWEERLEWNKKMDPGNAAPEVIKVLKSYVQSHAA